MFTGEIESNGVEAVKDVGTAHPSIKLYGGDGVVLNDFADPKKGLPTSVGSRFKGTIATLDPNSFNAQGKRQTSFATVDVTPEIEEVDLVIPEKDLDEWEAVARDTAFD